MTLLMVGVDIFWNCTVLGCPEAKWFSDIFGVFFWSCKAGRCIIMKINFLTNSSHDINFNIFHFFLKFNRFSGQHHFMKYLE